MEIGTRVRPVEGFDFDSFWGPHTLTDEGEVTGLAGDGIVRVDWDNGEIDDFASPAFEPVGGYYGDFNFETCGVIPVDEA